MFVLLYGGGLLLGTAWPAVLRFSDTMLLLALAGACFVNFARNRTLHCAITGPLFLLAALAAAAIEAGAWTLDWSVLWGVVLVGVGVAFLIEWRTVGRASTASNAP
jgi:hypothetical protein